MVCPKNGNGVLKGLRPPGDEHNFVALFPFWSYRLLLKLKTPCYVVPSSFCLVTRRFDRSYIYYGFELDDLIRGTPLPASLLSGLAFTVAFTRLILRWVHHCNQVFNPRIESKMKNYP